MMQIMKLCTLWIVIIIGVLSLNILSTTPASAASKTIGIIVFDGFLTSDVTAPVEVFGAASNQLDGEQFKVLIISSSKKLKIKSEEGLTIIADTNIYETTKVDVLIVPSAYDMKPHLTNIDLINFIKNQQNTNTWFNSNCSGAYLLAKAGILDGKNATTWAGGEKKLQQQYPKIKVQTDINVVIDGKVITSNGGPISYQAAFLLLSNLTTPEFSDKISTTIQFNRLSKAFH